MKIMIILLALLPGALLADPAEIVGAEARQTGAGWQVSVTLAHPDTGWAHYADAWRVELEDGTILGERILLHPHVEEQPFTRGLSGVVVPDGVGQVFIRARCLVDGWGDTRFAVTL